MNPMDFDSWEDLQAARAASLVGVRCCTCGAVGLMTPAEAQENSEWECDACDLERRIMQDDQASLANGDDEFYFG